MNGTRPSYYNDVVNYDKAWDDTMTVIWRDRLAHYRVGLSKTSTGGLFSSIAKEPPAVNGLSADFVFRFYTYGIFVDAGTGNGYKRNNGGNLEFLGKDYRREHHLGEPRKRKPWFSHSWYVYQRVLADKFADMMGDDFTAMFDNL